MKEGETIMDVATKIGTEFAAKVLSVKIWGPGAKFPGQEVSLSSKVQEGLKIEFE
jgi:ribosome-interacting GTPase 1